MRLQEIAAGQDSDIIPNVFLIFVVLLIFCALYGNNTKHSNEEKDKKAFEAHNSHWERVAVWHNKIWYIINDITISSEENGQGTLVNLPVIMRTRTRYDRIDTNKVEIKFAPAKPQ